MIPVPQVPDPAIETLQSSALQDADQSVAPYSRASRAASTWRAYESDWRIFAVWCRAVNLEALPAAPATVAMFVSVQADLGCAPATLTRRLAAIRLMHVGADLASPHDAKQVVEAMRGIRRHKKYRVAAKKAAAVDEDIKRMADAAQPNRMKQLRDRALILIGFAGALRRSELVALDYDHLMTRSEGLMVTITSSKTDPEGQGQTMAIPRVTGSPYCPVAAVTEWLQAAGITSGAVFRRLHSEEKVGARLTAQSVALIVKDLARSAGLGLPERYAGHSLPYSDEPQSKPAKEDVRLLVCPPFVVISLI